MVKLCDTVLRPCMIVTRGAVELESGAVPNVCCGVGVELKILMILQAILFVVHLILQTKQYTSRHSAHFKEAC